MAAMTDRKDSSTEDVKKELAELREEVHLISQAIPSQFTKDSVSSEKRSLAQSLSDYANDVVDSVMSGISSEIEKSVFVDPTGAWFDRHIARVQSRALNLSEAKRAASLMSAMASEHRIRILTELLYGGRYAEGYFSEHHIEPPQDPAGIWTDRSGKWPWPIFDHTARSNCPQDGHTSGPFPRTQQILTTIHDCSERQAFLRRKRLKSAFSGLFS
jgi:hypothetical protein